MKKNLGVVLGLQLSLCAFAQVEIEEVLMVADTVAVSACDTIQDHSIVYPESMEADLDNMLTDWYLSEYAIVDEGCLKNSVNINYPDSVYERRLAALPTIIEMPYNSVVRSHIDMYLQKRRGLVESLLGLSVYYMPIFEEALEKEGMPLELKYLPIIESALRPEATSRVGAAGLWQFMLRTGKSMGLEVNSLVDERRDPIKSSEKAARYLKSLYNIYHDWTLAIAAYNCGPGNVNKAIRRSGGKTDFWEIYPYLLRETRGYVPAFIAVNYVMNYYNEHNICPVLTRRPLLTDTIQVSGRLHLQQISEVLQLPIEEIRALNPQYRRDVIPGDNHPYTLVLPSQQVYAFIEAQDTIFAHNKELYARRTAVEPSGYKGDYSSGNKTYHKVRRGETLSTIGRKYGVSVKNLRKWNNLRKNSVLQIGQRLVVRGGHAAATSTASSSTSTSSGKTITHTVRRGESLWTISQKYKGVSADDIKRANGLRNNNIKAGQKLKIPAA